MIKLAKNWEDYKLLDADNGYRLERWGKIVLQRPDPQIIWNFEKTAKEWQNPAAIYHRSNKGGGSWEFKQKLPGHWHIKYGNLTFKVSPTGFKHTGVFPEQAANWDDYMNLIKNANRPVKVLNMFAYTGGATLACAAAGASVTHVDASKGMVTWARENAALSGMENKPIRWIVDDCKKFVSRELRRGNKYDAIIMDPPSYGRGPGGEVWKLEDALFPLLKESTQLLSNKPLFFAVNSYTTGVSSSIIAYMLERLICTSYGGNVISSEIGLPIESGMLSSKTESPFMAALPCGATTFYIGE